jgi:hypothetical protein
MCLLSYNSGSLNTLEPEAYNGIALLFPCFTKPRLEQAKVGLSVNPTATDLSGCMTGMNGLKSIGQRVRAFAFFAEVPKITCTAFIRRSLRKLILRYELLREQRT